MGAERIRSFWAPIQFCTLFLINGIIKQVEAKEKKEKLDESLKLYQARLWFGIECSCLLLLLVEVSASVCVEDPQGFVGRSSYEGNGKGGLMVFKKHIVDHFSFFN